MPPAPAASSEVLVARVESKQRQNVRYIDLTMTEPDELYTLRAQYWLGHYQLALDEAKSIMRRPMSPALKAEREEFALRCQIGMKDYHKVISASPDTPGTCRSTWFEYYPPSSALKSFVFALYQFRSQSFDSQGSV